MAVRCCRNVQWYLRRVRREGLMRLFVDVALNINIVNHI